MVVVMMMTVCGLGVEISLLRNVALEDYDSGQRPLNPEANKALQDSSPPHLWLQMELQKMGLHECNLLHN